MTFAELFKSLKESPFQINMFSGKTADEGRAYKVAQDKSVSMKLQSKYPKTTKLIGSKYGSGTDKDREQFANDHFHIKKDHPYDPLLSREKNDTHKEISQIIHGKGEIGGTEFIEARKQRLKDYYDWHFKGKGIDKSLVSDLGDLYDQKAGERMPEPEDGIPIGSVAVMNGSKILMGKRRDSGKWTLPGGHVEKGESYKEGARRELEEETGIKSDKLETLGREKVRSPDGKDLMISCYKVNSDEHTTMRDDPDNEVERWEWKQTPLSPEILNNLHAPKNVTLKLLGFQDWEKKSKMDKSIETLMSRFLKSISVKHQDYEDTPESKGSSRRKMLKGLKSQTKTKQNESGETEYLLHRGMGAKEHKKFVKDGACHHHTCPDRKIYAWTTDRKKANEYRDKYSGEEKGQRVSAWIHEKDIHSQPDTKMPVSILKGLRLFFKGDTAGQAKPNLSNVPYQAPVDSESKYHDHSTGLKTPGDKGPFASNPSLQSNTIGNNARISGESVSPNLKDYTPPVKDSGFNYTANDKSAERTPASSDVNVRQSGPASIKTW